MTTVPVLTVAVDTSSTEDLHSHYDFIIIGGGTAGMVVASRLSEDPAVSVLVLEAGSNKLKDPRITTPGLALATWSDPEFDWCNTTVPQKFLNNRVVALPSGRTLGGSSAINMGLIAYPAQTDIDAWGKLGNLGWDWESMKPYYRKFYSFAPPSDEVRQRLSLDYMDNSLQGNSGPVSVSFGEAQGPLETAWPTTMQNLNLRTTVDPLTGFEIGGHSNPGAVDSRTLARSHAGSAFYSQEVQERPNLRVVTDAYVERVIICPTSRGAEARAVRFESKEGHKWIIEAGSEVILSCGSIHSPRLLELSGIGSRKLLQSHHIETVIDNPAVGENLQDHVTSVISFEVADGVPSADAFRDPAAAEAAMLIHSNGQPGPLSSSTYSSAFTSTVVPPEQREKSLRNGLPANIPRSGGMNYEAGVRSQYKLLASMLLKGHKASGHFFLGPFQMNIAEGPSPQQYLKPIHPSNFLSILASLSHPFSRGSVHITSSNPLDPPLIDPAYLSHPLDREIAARNVQFLQTIAATAPFCSLLKRNGQRIPANVDVSSIEAAREHLKLATTNFHLVGTCAMMPRERGGVVGERLVVHGTKNLRVVDASVVPLIPRGNIQSTVYAIAERAADLIKEDLARRKVAGAAQNMFGMEERRRWVRSKL